MVERNVSFQTGGVTLYGTVCLPKGEESVPIVLFVHGSGPLDRDENTNAGKLNVFNQIAHFLSDSGIGSFRYDKRGCGKSSGNYLTAGHFDFVSDAQAAVSYLKENDFGKSAKIYVLGHSEGCLIAPQVAKLEKNVSGIILLCPFLQPLKRVLESQAIKLQEDIYRLGGIRGGIARLTTSVLGIPPSSQQKLIQKIEKSTKPCLRYGFRKVNAKWFRDLFGLSMQNVYTDIPCTVLIIGGAKDIQCDANDIAHIKTLINCDSTEVHILSDMTHILRRDYEPPSFFHYQELLKREIDIELLHIIRKWIASRENR